MNSTMSRPTGSGEFPALEARTSSSLESRSIPVKISTTQFAKPRLAILGPLLGVNPGRVTSQGEILARLLQQDGYSVRTASSALNRYKRLAEIVWELISHHRDVDCLCLQTYTGLSFVVEDLASRFAKLYDKRVIMHLHGGAMPDFVRRYPAWSRRVLARADRLVTPSPYLARCVAELGFSAHVIPNVIELADYPFRERSVLQPRLLWMRAFHPIYNPLMALRVLSQLRRTHPGATLVMAGQAGELSETVRREAEALGLADAVTFPGFLNPPAKLAAMSYADIFINTNHIDNTPVSVIEAGAMGLPIVATRIGGIADLITDRNSGLLVPDDDDLAMVDSIRSLLEDPKLARTLSVNGRAVAAQFAWTRVRELWYDLFDSIVADREGAN